MHLVIGVESFAGRHAVTALGQHGPVRGVAPGDNLAAALAGVEVIHVAGELYSPFDRLAWRARGRRGQPNPWLVQLVRLARLAGVRRVVFLSSASALGSSRNGRLSERSQPRPEHPLERLLNYDERWLRRQSNPEVVVLRAAQPFGPGEPVMTRLLGRMLRGRLRLPCGGRASRTFVSGDDLGRAFVAAALRGSQGGAYLVGGVKGSWRDLMTAAADALTVRPRIGSVPYDLAYLAAALRTASGLPVGSDCWATPFAVDMIARPQIVEDGWDRRELCWQPEVTSLEQGLAELADWVRNAQARPDLSRAPSSAPGVSGEV